MNPLKKYKEDNPLITWGQISEMTGIHVQTLWIIKEMDMEKIKDLKLKQVYGLKIIGIDLLENYEKTITTA